MTTYSLIKQLLYFILLLSAFPPSLFATEHYLNKPDTKTISVRDISSIGTVDKDYGCAANAVANLFGYWNDHGCDFFFDAASGTKLSTGLADTENVNSMLEELYTDLKSFSVTFPVYGEQDLTASANMAPGIRAALSHYGISATVTPGYLFSFDAVKSEIDSGRPCIVGVAPNFNSKFFIHYAVAVGYEESEDVHTAPDRIIILDFRGTTSQPFYMRGLGMGLNPLYFCSIKPECAEE